MPSGMKSLIVEGWRFIHHSYAVVNQWQLLALRRRSDVSLQISDVPFCSPYWQIQRGLFHARDEEALAALPVAPPGSAAALTLRISYPFDFSPSASQITAVFATSERQSLRHDSFRSSSNLTELRGQPRFRIVTPSNWSARGFLKVGFSPEQILVVPHG